MGGRDRSGLPDVNSPSATITGSVVYDLSTVRHEGFQLFPYDVRCAMGELVCGLFRHARLFFNFRIVQADAYENHLRRV